MNYARACEYGQHKTLFLQPDMFGQRMMDQTEKKEGKGRKKSKDRETGNLPTSPPYILASIRGFARRDHTPSA